MLRRAAQAGFTPDEVAAAAYAAASERKRPGEQVHVLFAECTTADAGYDAERLNREFAGLIEAEGTLLDEIPERLDRFHYDLVATTTFHADEAQALVGGRVPVVAMLVGPGYVELVHEIAALPEGSRVGVVCASDRGTENIAETLAIAGTKGVELVSATIGDDERLDARRPNGGPHPDVARGARPEAGPAAPPAGARAAVDVRVRPRRPRAAAPRDRARRRGAARAAAEAARPGTRRGSDILRPMRAIPLARAARRRHGLEPIVGRDGTLDAADAGAARRIAARLTAARDAAGRARRQRAARWRRWRRSMRSSIG